jgi:pimeloyl-ACP methyl ester carboxylesterase
MVSGSPLLSGDMMELLHAGAQGSWDIRRLLSWLRLPEQDAPAVGVLGHSLGGYTAALLAGLADNIDAVVCANPSVEPSHMFWRDGLSAATRYLKTNGMTQKKSDQLLRVVSPLAFEPRVPKEGRAVIASLADRIIPVSEPHELWQHWDEPRVLWHQGTHFGLLQTDKGKEAVRETLRDAGVLHST